jgi:hypothetical protein
MRLSHRYSRLSAVGCQIGDKINILSGRKDSRVYFRETGDGALCLKSAGACEKEN